MCTALRAVAGGVGATASRDQFADALMPVRAVNRAFKAEEVQSAAPVVPDAVFDSPNARTKRGANSLTGASLLGG